MPFERLVQKCRDHGVLSLVDGAHGIGHIPLDLTALDADFFLSNLHKWFFVPRGCALLYVPVRNQPLIRSSIPTSVAWKPRDVTGPFRFPSATTPYTDLFEFVGVADSQNYLVVPAAQKFREELCGGEDMIRDYCFKLAREGGDKAAEILETEVMDHPQSHFRDCALVNIRLPLEVGDEPGKVKPEHVRAVAGYLRYQSGVEYDTVLQVLPYKGQFWLRLSAQVYLELSDFEYVAGVAKELCGKVRSGEFLNE